MKLTTTSIRALELPASVRERTFFDDDLPGFGVRLRSGGSKGYVVQYKINGQNRRMSLGLVASLDLGKARSTAKDLLARVRLGGDPAGEKIEQRARAAETFGATLPAFLARQRQRLKLRSFLETDRYLTKYAKPWHGRPVSGIDRRAAALLVGEVAEKHGRVAANRFRAALSAYFTWMLREGLTESNPVLATNKQVEASARQRRLSDSELAAIWCNAGDDQYGAIVRLLMLTACRRDEIGDLCWSEVDLDAAVITLPGAKTKNKRDHRVPLSSLALEILRAQPRRPQSDGTIRDLVFGHRTGRGYGGWSKSKAELDQRLEQAGTPVSGWTLHDFRRSVSTAMHEVLNVQPHVVEAVLNHVSGHKGGVAGVYNVSSYDVQKAVALQKWSDHIEALVTDKRPTATVTKLRRRS